MRCSTLRRAAATLVLSALSATALAACGGSSAPVQDVASNRLPKVPNSDPARPVFGTASIRGGVVQPGSIRVQPGETIWITNTDRSPHALSDDKDKLSTGNIQPGATATIAAPDQVGTYQLTDSHKLRLTVVVF